MNLPLGFRYSALYAGIRKAQKDDLSLIVRAEDVEIEITNRMLGLHQGELGQPEGVSQQT